MFYWKIKSSMIFFDMPNPVIICYRIEGLQLERAGEVVTSPRNKEQNKYHNIHKLKLYTSNKHQFNIFTTIIEYQCFYC